MSIPTSTLKRPDLNARTTPSAATTVLDVHDSAAEDDLDEYVSIISDSPTPVGTGDRPEIYESEPSASVSLGCSDIVKTVSIHPNGDLKACCGHTMFYQKDLHLGNIMEDNLTAILDRAAKNTLYWYMHAIGSTALLSSLGVSGRFTSICHACKVLLNEHRQEVLEYLHERGDSGALEDLLFQANLKKAAQKLIANEDELIKRLHSSVRTKQKLESVVGV